MSDKKLKALKEEISGDNKPCVWPVVYNGGHRKEIEVQITILSRTMSRMIMLSRIHDCTKL